MPVKISWYNPEETVIYVRYEPGWAWEEHHKAVEDASTMSRERGLKFSLCIFDLRGSVLPSNSPAAKHHTSPKSNAYIVIVMDNAFARTIAQIGILLAREQQRFEIVSKIEEADAIVKKRLSKEQVL